MAPTEGVQAGWAVGVRVHGNSWTAVWLEGGEGWQRKGVEAIQGTRLPRVEGEPLEGLGQRCGLTGLKRSLAAE